MPCLKGVARDILAFLADVGDDHAHVGNRHGKHIHDFNRGKTRIEKVASAQQHLFLQALEAAVGDERVGVLEYVVVGHFAAGDFAGGQRFAFLGGDDADFVFRNIDHVCQLDVEENRVDPIVARRNQLDLWAALAARGKKVLCVLVRIAFDALGDHAPAGQRFAVVCLDHADFALRNIERVGEFHREQQRINAVGSRWNHLHLRAAFAAAQQKRTRVLEKTALDIARDDAPAGQRLAVAGLHHADLALRNHGEFHHVDGVLPRPQAQVQARRQRVCLVARFAVERDDLSVGQIAVGAEDDKFFGHCADAVVGHDDDAEQPQKKFPEKHQQNNRDHAANNAQITSNGFHDLPLIFCA